MKDIIIAIVSNAEFMNAVITAIAALASWGIAKLFAAKPEWKKYEGLLITAVKIGKKLVPEGTPNIGLQRAAAALTVFEQQYTAAYGKLPTEAILQVAKLALPIVHDRIEAAGNL
jgi:hypothetical protein